MSDRSIELAKAERKNRQLALGLVKALRFLWRANETVIRSARSTKWAELAGNRLDAALSDLETAISGKASP